MTFQNGFLYLVAPGRAHMDPMVIVCVADWNLSPAELQESQWLQTVGGRIVVPSNSTITYHGGNGSLIDYAVLSDSAPGLMGKLGMSRRMLSVCVPCAVRL